MVSKQVLVLFPLLIYSLDFSPFKILEFISRLAIQIKPILGSFSHKIRSICCVVVTGANLSTFAIFLFKILSLKWHKDKGVEQGGIKWMFEKELKPTFSKENGGQQKDDDRVHKIVEL